MSVVSSIRRILCRDPQFMPREAYSQDGEDLILERLLDGQTSGFYVDVGAHHPMRFSNTYLFYKRGWRGVNVDAQPGSMALFRRHRPFDTNLEVGCGSIPGRFPYFRFNEPALNTFDPEEAKRKDVSPYRLIEEVNVPIRRLDDILEAHLPAGRTIDFLSIDVEGRDLDVLQSNDWVRFRPRFILAETLRAELMMLEHDPVVQFLRGVGYAPVGKAYNTTFFRQMDAIK